MSPNRDTLTLDSDEVLKAFQQAKELNLCPNRIWAVAGENLPKLLPDRHLMPCEGEDRHKQESSTHHKECTSDFCEYSQRNFTAVQQRHECKGNECPRLRGHFPRYMLEKAAELGKPTAWKLAGWSFLEYPLPYMAISHVWADGTGIGAWKDGEVNQCLYAFFQDIAKQFQCDGIWWDTLCIPREKAARNKAIQNIKNNYEDARITLVHDQFLRNWPWDPETACFAFIMSPWFSRGWTALELSKSRKVKMIFKGQHGPIIKDLDEDILDKEIISKERKANSPRTEASRIIRRLRTEITTLNDLLIVLSPRYTSWPEDIATIAALLVGVTREIHQQETYKNILKKLRYLSPGHLFHNAATMSNGFSWCPTKLFDLPLDSSTACLTISEHGDIQGAWRVIPVEGKLECWWNDTHPLMKRRLQSALRHPTKCRLLAECYPGRQSEPVRRALLVSKTQESSRYEYVGVLWFRQELRAEGGNWSSRIQEVIISSSRNNEELFSGFTENMIADDRSDISHSEIEKDDRSQCAVQADRLRHAIWRGDYRTFNELSQNAKLDIPDKLDRRPLHLAAERGHIKMVKDLIRYKFDLHSRCYYDQTALHHAAWGGFRCCR